MFSKVQPLRFPSKVPKKRTLLKGSAGEETYTQQLVGNGTCYVGVSSLVRKTLTDNAGWLQSDHPLNHIAVSILRVIFKRELGVDVVNLSQDMAQLSPPIHYNGVFDTKCQLRGIQFYSRTNLLQNQSNPTVLAANVGKVVVSPSFSIDTSSPTTKFSTLAANLAAQLQHWYCKVFLFTGDGINNNENLIVRELYGYSATMAEDMNSTDNTAHKAQRHTPIRRLDTRKVKVKMDTKVMIVPTGTKGGLSDAQVDERDMSTYVHQDAYVGKMYYFRDPYPVVDLENIVQYQDNTSALYNTTDQQGAVSKIIYDTNGDGIMRPNTDTNFIGLGHFPLDTAFSNLARTGSFMCSNGGTRTINLSFDFYGPINKFFKGYKYIDVSGINTPNYPNIVGGMNGTCILFAIKQHNPQSYTSLGTPALEPIYVGLTVKRRIYTMLGKEERYGMDVDRMENNLTGLTETAVPKDLMNF